MAAHEGFRAKENVLPIERAGHAVAAQGSRIGSILLADGKLNAADIERILALQREEGLRFGEAAVRLALITVEDLRRAIAKQYGFPYIGPTGDGISSELVAAFSPHDRRAEELRTLRSQLLIRW